MRDATNYAGVNHLLVRTLIDRGLLPAKQVVPDAPWQIRPADLDCNALRAAMSIVWRTPRDLRPEWEPFSRQKSARNSRSL